MSDSTQLKFSNDTQLWEMFQCGSLDSSLNIIYTAIVHCEEYDVREILWGLALACTISCSMHHEKIHSTSLVRVPCILPICSHHTLDLGWSNWWPCCGQKTTGSPSTTRGLKGNCIATPFSLVAGGGCLSERWWATHWTTVNASAGCSLGSIPAK